MATPTLLTASFSDTDASSYNTASISPSGNRLITLMVLSRAVAGDANVPTISGNSLTWVEEETIIDGNRITAFRAMSATPSTGQVTISFGGQTQMYCHWKIVEWDGVDLSGTHGSGAVRQSVSAKDVGTNTGLSITLAAFGNANNAASGAVRSGNAVTPGAGFTELSETTGDAIFEDEWKSTQDTSVDWSWSSTASFALGIALEIKSILSSTQTEAITLSDSLLKQGQKVLSQVLTNTDTVIRTVIRTLSDSLTIANVLTSLKIITANMTLETLAIGNAIARSLLRTFAEAPALIDTIRKNTSRTVTETATITATLLKLPVRLLGDAILTTGSMLRTISRTAVETLPLAQSYLTQLARTLSDPLMLVETFTRGLTYARTFTESFAITQFIRSFLNGLNVRYSAKFSSRGTSYNEKYTNRGSEDEAKYPPR
jgi:hypothetical protein